MLQKFLLIVAILFTTACVNAKAIIYPAPEGVRTSPEYELEVDGKDVFCYGTYRMDHSSNVRITGGPVSPLAFAIFDFTGKVKVRLRVKPGVLSETKMRVRPLASGIKPVIKGIDLVEFTLDKPGNYTFDPRGDGFCAIHLFTNTPEKDIPDPKDPKVKYFGPGLHILKKLNLKSNETMYIAGGGVVLCRPEVKKSQYPRYGIVLDTMERTIDLSDTTGVTIKGRGIISSAGAIQMRRRQAPFKTFGVKNFVIKDIVVLESACWNFALFGCKNVLMDNIKILSFYVNSDGICPSSGCENIKVVNCFVNNGDDALEVKAMGTVWGGINDKLRKYLGDCKNITFENCQVWSNQATPLGITHEIDHNVDNVTFKNITILHHTAPGSRYQTRGQISIFPAGGGSVSNITFENITVESAKSGYQNCIVIDNIHGSGWHEVKKIYQNRPYSKVGPVLFKNIRMKTQHPTVRLINWGKEGTIKDIVFENVILNGRNLYKRPFEITSQKSSFLVKP